MLLTLKECSCDKDHPLFSPNTTGGYGINVQASGGVDVPQLSVGDPPFNAAISAQSESDLYQFEILNPGTYTIETEGTTDVFLTLFGPNSQTTELASDDDSGTGRNSRIRLELATGDYFVAVRHYSAFGTGEYSIRVSSS